MKKVIAIVLCLSMLSFSQSFAENNINFNDLNKSHWAYKSIITMVENGVLQGFEDNTFRPDAKVTREQFAKMLVLAFDLPLKYPENPTFADVPRDSWSYPYIETAKQYLTGYKSGNCINFKGSKDAVREDMAVAIVLAKSLDQRIPNLDLLNSFSDNDKISPGIRNYVALAVEDNIVQGYEDNLLGPQKTLSRAEASILIFNAGVIAENEKIAMFDITNFSDSIMLDNTVKISIPYQASTTDNPVNYKIFNDGCTSFQYPKEFSFVNPNMPNQLPGFQDYDTFWDGNIFRIKVVYTNYSRLGLNSTTLSDIATFWEKQYSGTEYTSYFSNESFVMNINKNSPDGIDDLIDYRIYGRGIDEVGSYVIIVSNKKKSELSIEENNYLLKLIDQLSNTYKIISSISPLKGRHQ